jgi:hypothetical protein
MDTTTLDKCIRIVNHYELDDDEIERLEGDQISISKEYIRPFSSELNQNLLEKDSKKSKAGIIRHYLFEFRCHADLGDQFYETANEIFEALIFEIKLCCIKYKINFVEICAEFDISTIHTEQDIVYLGYDDSESNDLENPTTEIESKDRRRSERAPTNPEKLKALKEFAPELFKNIMSLPSKGDKGKILRLITGVNQTDAYKITLPGRNLDGVKVKGLDNYLNILKEAKNNPFE